MKRNIFKIVQVLIVTAGILSCTGSNLYKDLASNKTTDEALYEDAQKLIDSADYTGAITKILATTADFQATAKVKESLAGAYAARCGMEFIPFVTNLTGGSSSSFFQMAMNGFVGVSTANYADCVTAESIIESIGVIGVRSQSENLFLLVLEMAKIGNRLRADADILPTDAGDGTVDAGFSCSTSVPIADAKAIIESFYKFLSLFAVVGSTLSGVSGIQSFLDSFGGSLPALDYSGGLDASEDEADPPILLSRAMINSQSFGVGSCNNADPTQCVCPP
ncbi:MAG TPA: hypothetical protein VIG33_14195 [Pseudobdellovibrionaceae bacterium]|jgi:hypothetical protein